MSTERARAKRIAYIGWLAAVVVLVGLTALLLRNWLRGGLPTSPRQETIPELAITWMFREELGQGQLLSEWNPTWFSGFPWLRFLSYPFYYALAATSLWGGLPLETVMVLYYFLVMAASGLAMFAYLQRVLGDWRPALVGAVIYEAFPYHNYVGVETWIHAAVWVLVPLALWLIERYYATASRHLGRLTLIGITLGLFPIVSSEYTIIAGPFVGLYLLARVIVAVRQRMLGVGRAVAGLALIGAVALGIAAFYVLPGILEVQYVGIHAKHGAASTFTDELLRDYAVTPRLVWYALARRLHLPASDGRLPGIVQSFWSVTWYPGLIVLASALLGLYAIGRRRTFAGCAAIAGLVLSGMLVTGPTWPWNPFPALPVLGRLSPFRGMLLVVVWLSILAAHGMVEVIQWGTRLSKRGPRWRQEATAGALVVAAIALIGLDFGPSSSAYMTTEAYFGAAEQEAYAWLREHATGGRFWDVAGSPREAYRRTLSLSQFPMPRYWGYYDNGAPLYTHRQVTATDLATSLELHQVRYALLRQADSDAPQREAKLQEAGYRPVWEGQGVSIWQDVLVGSYARFFPTVALDISTDSAASLTAMPHFVQQGIALVAADSLGNDYSLPSTGHMLADAEVEGLYLFADDLAYVTSLQSELPSTPKQVITPETLDAIRPIPPMEVLAYAERRGYESLYVGVSVPESGVLTVAESWYPHWRVFVDGEARPTLRVNVAFLGVWLEPGDHRIEFRWQRPWYLYLGFVITGVTWLVVIFWWTWYLGLALNSRYRPILLDFEAFSHAQDTSEGDGEQPYVKA